MPPASLFRGPIEKVLLRKARYEVEKNLSRLAADWNDRVMAVIEELRQQTELEAQSELGSLQRMLGQTASDTFAGPGHVAIEPMADPTSLAQGAPIR